MKNTYISDIPSREGHYQLNPKEGCLQKLQPVWTSRKLRVCEYVILPWQLIHKTNQRTSQSLMSVFFLSQVQWKPLMDEIFATNFTDSDTLYVVDPSYLEKLHQMLIRFQDR